jgi:outer membrane protein insertion porin family
MRRLTMLSRSHRILMRIRVLAAVLSALALPVALSAPGARAQAPGKPASSSSVKKTTASGSSSASASASAAPSTSASASSTSTTTSMVDEPPVATNKIAGGAVGPEVPEIPQKLPSGAAYEGKPVVAVRSKVVGVIWTKPPQLTYPKVGDKLSLAKATEQLRLLLGSGGFATGELAVGDEGNGVSVVYELVPARFVRRVVLIGNILADDEVRRASGLADVADVTEKSLDRARTDIRALYAKRGYPEALVEVSTIETDQPLTVIVNVRIDAQRSLDVTSRTFVGLPTWDPGAMRAAQDYSVRVGDRADEESLDTADRNLTSALRGGGFPNAAVTHAITPADNGTGAEITITIVTGAKIVMLFEGNVVYDDQGLLDILDLKTEADRSSLHLSSKISDAYVRRGYLDVEVIAELLGDVADAQRTMRFRIQEGERVAVEQRVYPCLRGALDAKRLNTEIDSYLDEEVSGEGFGDVDPAVADRTILSSGSNVETGARPYPNVPDPKSVYDPEIYDRAVEHLGDLFRSEGYIFAQISPPTVLRAGCAKGSKPGACLVLPLPPLPDVCRSDLEQLPMEATPIPKSFTCVPEPSKGKMCAPTVTIVIPVNPGPRSILWDVAFDGTKGLSPALLGGPKVAGQALRLGQPLSLQDVEQARKAVLEWYRDEGYAFAAVRATLEYSPDKSRARVRFIVVEGELVLIDNIYVEGHKKTLESLIRARLLISRDGVYHQNLVEQSQERLAQLGVFSSVSIGLINPTIPAKRKNVIVTVVERPAQHVEVRPGFSTGEGLRYYSEYGYSNLFGYAVSLDFRLKISYQPFLGCRQQGVNDRGEKTYNCGTSSFYDADVVRRWNTLDGLDRFPRRISLGVTLPHSPIFGATVRTSLELVNSLDLFRDFKLDRYTPILTFTYNPVRWFTAIFAGDLEYNKFLLFDKQQLNVFLNSKPQFSALLRVPDGNTGVAATRATFTFDWRDNRLGATKNGFVSLTNEYVRSIVQPDDIVDTGSGVNVLVKPPRQEFLHITGATGVYFKIDELPKKPVLAIELAAGGNFNVFGCSNAGETVVPQSGGGQQSYKICDTYPDRRFYLGGVDSNRGFLPGQMLAQDVIDDIRGNTSDPNIESAVIGAPRGGNVFINPRIELRVPAFKWGGFVIFLDAANTWADKSRFLRDRDGRFAPWRLRYSIGPGLSIDTPVGPIALDLGFNLSRYELFNEPPVAFNFSIGRF